MATKNRLDHLIERIDNTRVNIPNPYGIPITMFANPDVPIEAEAIHEILRFAEIVKTIEDINRVEPGFWGGTPASLDRIGLSPDFHKGAGIPIGTIAKTTGFFLPQAPGTDICCGMRLSTTDVRQEELAPCIEQFKQKLREIFFEGKREISMSPRQRSAMLLEGLWGLLDNYSDNKDNGLWKYYDPTEQEKDLLKVHFQGNLPAKNVFTFADYITGSGQNDARDAHAGSIGQGNHFQEVQNIEEIIDGAIARAWGVHKGYVAIMSHSGSLGLGHAVGGYFKDQAIAIFPKKLKRPENGFFPIPATHPMAAQYFDAMRNAANFGFANRMFLGMMAVRALSETLGRHVQAKLVYDAPHNLIWEENGYYLHRKGATPAEGPDEMFPMGKPVIVPGSMADASYLLAGQGNEDAMSSACHGAGRAISRGAARKYSSLDEISKLHVVTPLDPNSYKVRSRPDIMKEYETRLMEEKKSSYKDIMPVCNSIAEANIAKPVARLWPIVTIKG